RLLAPRTIVNTSTTFNTAQTEVTRSVPRVGRPETSTRRKAKYSASATRKCSTSCHRRTVPTTGTVTSTMRGATTRVAIARASTRWTAIVAAASVAAAFPDGTNPNAHSAAHSDSASERLPKNVNGYGLAAPYDMT